MKHRILIAADDPAQVELLESVFSDIDCGISLALDAADTLARAVSFEPDLILLDLSKPEEIGVEICRQLKQDPDTFGIRILIVTALSELHDIERIVDAGADDFVSKPVDKAQLVRRVKTMLRL